MDNFYTIVENAQINQLNLKLGKRYREYLQAIQSGNRLAQNNILKTLLDECRSKENLSAVARKFVEEKLKISYRNLLLMKRHRLI